MKTIEQLIAEAAAELLGTKDVLTEARRLLGVLKERAPDLAGPVDNVIGLIDPKIAILEATLDKEHLLNLGTTVLAELAEIPRSGLSPAPAQPGHVTGG